MAEKPEVPDNIYLQVEDEWSEIGATWCDGRINDTDIEYVLKSVADEKIKESYSEGYDFAKQDARRAWRERVEELEKKLKGKEIE